MISLYIKSMPNRNHDRFTSVKIAPEMIMDLSPREKRHFRFAQISEFPYPNMEDIKKC